MSKIKFEPGDTLGGTAPIILLKQIEHGGGRIRRNRYRRHAKWPYAVALAAGAVAVYAWTLY